MNKVITFVLGAAIGSLVTWKLIEEKYRKIADEEIESVRKYYKDRYDMLANDLPVVSSGLSIVEPCKETESVTTVASTSIGTRRVQSIPEPAYNKILNELGYTDEEMQELLDDPDVIIEEHDGEYEIIMGAEIESTEPYIIAPEEYGEKDDYITKSWTYYSDFVLADEEGEIISDPESIIGDALAHFGEYEDDSVHVRNDTTECDYEIIKHEKTFSEIYGSKVNV